MRKGKEEGRGREGKGDCLTPGCEILAPPLPLATQPRSGNIPGPTS